MIRPRRLFDDITTEEAFAKQLEKALTTVAELPSTVLQTSSLDGLVNEVVAAYWIDPLALHWDTRTVDSAASSVQVERAAASAATASAATSPVRMMAIEEFIPFSGGAGLFDMRPSEPPPEPAHGSVREEGLALTWAGEEPDASIRTHFRLEESNLRTWVAAVNRDVNHFDANLRRAVRTAVKARLKALQLTADALAGLGLPPRQHGLPRVGRSQARGSRSAARGPDLLVSTPRRGPGRPGWTPELFEDRWAEACRLTPTEQTYPALAKHFRGLDGMVGELTGDHLGKLRRRFLGQGQ